MKEFVKVRIIKNSYIVFIGLKTKMVENAFVSFEGEGARIWFLIKIILLQKVIFKNVVYSPRKYGRCRKWKIKGY